MRALKNPKLVRYILTPEGIREKTAKTYHFIVRNYKQILKARKYIVGAIGNLEHSGIEKIYFHGKKDELFELLTITVDEELGGFGERFEYIGSTKRLVEIFRDSKDDLVKNGKTLAVVWDSELAHKLEDQKILCLNLLEDMKFDEV